jgi:uncharacterized membrane protein HdeD (DUF308 family)
MKWMITSIFLGTANVIVMGLFAASKLGPTPIMMPMYLAIVSLCSSIISIVIAIISKKKHNSTWVLHLVSATIWIGLVVFNFWAFKSVLYVA